MNSTGFMPLRYQMKLSGRAKRLIVFIVTEHTTWPLQLTLYTLEASPYPIWSIHPWLSHELFQALPTR